MRPCCPLSAAAVKQVRQPLQSRFAHVGFRPTRRAMAPMPKEEHSAHTISQRLRTLRKIPPELIPLGVVLAFALVAAVFSLIRKLMTDRTLRLTRQGKE
ncbi:hypothetical protein BDY21DRAFT_159678 [Lineolata rhizophorae]|uniref:Uncharacterized protein n=1 Tax=Lineolata rhizophorae TaxID=578093 RepID=A0A6A6P8M8_9PEZI|nr:hypothetical protein BDY21DRAFT_159678 [Lineolata rhizophorae]